MRKTPFALLALAMTLTTTTANAEAEAVGTFLRDGTEPFAVRIEDGLLYCTRVEDNFELCNGMEKQDDGTWQGNKLKNPDMPRFMKFAGTISFEDNDMHLQGCTMGGSMCKTLTWPMQ